MRKGLSSIVVLAILLSFTTMRVYGEIGFQPRQELPPLLEFLDGRKVVSPKDWEERREEIRDLMIKYFIGNFPKKTPQLTNSEIISDEYKNDGSRRLRIKTTWTTPNRASFEFALWVPKGKGPYPLLITAPKDYQLLWAKDALQRGYAVCLFPGIDSHHREKDYPEYDSVWETFRREYPKATWTEISTKGWLASRCIDFLTSSQSIIEIKPKQISMIGFSRYGKQAMIAASFDSRITCVVARSPGSPASSPYRLTSRNTFAETPVDFPSEWFLKSLKDYSGREDELPIDAHGWYALIAPRHCLIHTAHNDGAEPTFAVEKAYVEGRSVYQFLGNERHLQLDYREGGHASVGVDRISFEDRKRNLDWIDKAFEIGDPGSHNFKEELLFDFDWKSWRQQQKDKDLEVAADSTPVKRIHWILGKKTSSPSSLDESPFLTAEESSLMTHDRWKPKDVSRVPIAFGDDVRGNLYFKTAQQGPAPVVIWLHPYSYHSGYNEGYGVQGTTVYNRLAQNGFAVIAYDQFGFGLRLLEGKSFYDKHPEWSRLGRMVKDARDAIDFVVDGKGKVNGDIPKLDSERIFLLGYSLGSLTAMYSAALDDNVAGMACFSGWTPMRSSNNKFLWDFHALLPRLGLYEGRENSIPIDYDEIINLAARKPCLVVTPKQDRFADFSSVSMTMTDLVSKNKTISWIASDGINRFQADQHKIFLDWVKKITP